MSVAFEGCTASSQSGSCSCSVDVFGLGAAAVLTLAVLPKVDVEAVFGPSLSSEPSVGFKAATVSTLADVS